MLLKPAFFASAQLRKLSPPEGGATAGGRTGSGTRVAVVGGAGMGYSTTSNGSGGGGGDNARSQVMPNASNNRLSTVIGGRLRMRAGAGVITDKHP